MHVNGVDTLGNRCVWCPNGPCTNGNSNQCEPKEWLDSMTNSGYEDTVDCPSTDIIFCENIHQSYYQRSFNNPPLRGSSPPYLGGVMNLFLKSSDPSGACGGLFEKVNFPFNVFVKCPIK